MFILQCKYFIPGKLSRTSEATTLLTAALLPSKPASRLNLRVCFWWSSLFLVQLKITRACFVTLPFCPDLHRLSLRFRSWLILTERKLEDNRSIFNLDVYLTKLTFKLLPMFSICGFYRQLQNY